MERATAQNVAKIAHVDVKTVRKYADKGYLDAKRDLNGWRIFPDPERAAKRIRELLCHNDETR